MRKSLILVFIAVGVGASYAAGVTEVATGTGMDDPSTWRWQVNAILTQQNVTVSRPAADLHSFDQGYERYSPRDFSTPTRPFSISEIFGQLGSIRSGGCSSFCGSGPHQIFGDKPPPNQPKTSFRVR